MKGLKQLAVGLWGLFGSREGLCALLFLGCLLFGGGTVLFGGLRTRTACAGWTRPEVKTLVKADPSVPHRTWELAGSDVPGGVKGEDLTRQIGQWTAKAEKTVGAALEEQRFFIQLYGGVQRVMGRTFVEDQVSPSSGVARLKNGQLTFVGSDEAERDEQAADLKRFQLALADNDIPLLYVQAPSKLEPGADSLPYGVADTSNQAADELLAALEEAEIETLDLREVLAGLPGEWNDWFYDTDHHWNQDGAFTAFRAIAARLEDFHYKQEPREEIPAGEDEIPAEEEEEPPVPIVIDPRFTDPASYDRSTLESFFLGSQGKRVGTLYGGVDDFALWSPGFATLLRYNAPDARVDNFGALEDTILFPERIETMDYYNGNPYTYYAGSDYPITWITNYYNPEGPKIVLLRDSYACAVTPFLAVASSQLVTIDPRYFWGDELTYIRRIDPDVVIVMFSPGMIRGQSGIRFMAQPVTSGKGDSLRWEQPLRDAPEEKIR